MSGPQGLKPEFLVALSGTAEAVPFPKNLPRTIYETSSTYLLLRQSFQQGRTGNPRPENVPILATHANDFAFATTLQTSHTRGHSQTVGEKHRCRPVSGAHHGFQQGLRRRARPRCPPARPGSRALVCIYRVTDIVTNIATEIDQERQTLPRLAAFQTVLGAARTRVPAGRRDPQPPSGKRRESHRQIEILDPR